MSSTNKTTYNSKIVLLGDTGVGKTSIAYRFVNNTFTPYQESTIGAGYLSKIVEKPNFLVKFEIWDTAGQERYEALVPLYYRGAHIAIIVFDVSSSTSFEKGKQWVKRIKKEHPQCCIFFVGNKADDTNARLVTTEEATIYAKKQTVFFMEVSAKKNTNIQDLFSQISDKVPQLISLQSPPNTSIQVNSIQLPENSESYWSSCCYG